MAPPFGAFLTKLSHPPGSVLILEDDTLTRDALVRVLRRLGYHTVAVETVAAAMEKLDGPSNAILDLNLPDGNGTTVLKRIRTLGLPVKVAISSGTAETRLLEEAQQNAPDIMLAKPIDVHALVEWLEAG